MTDIYNLPTYLYKIWFKVKTLMDVLCRNQPISAKLTKYSFSISYGME